jgi:microcystin degradation protein MlrC
MKILIARMNHETNTFSPVPTPLAAFGNHGPTYDAAAYHEHRGMRTAMSAFIDAAERAGAQLVTPISAAANPSGLVAREAYDAICDAIVAAAPGCDVVLLDLHGAMVAEQTADGEGDLLARVRAALPDAPIGVALDLHANVTQRMIDSADVIVSFKTYPHIDMYECGEHAARILFAQIEGRARPVLAWRQPPLMVHTLRSASAEGAMRRAIDAARAAEGEGMLAVSILSGFSLADIPAPCISVIVVGDGDPAAAEAVAERIGRQIWDDRADFVYHGAPLGESVAEAARLAHELGAARGTGGDVCTAPAAATGATADAAPASRPVLLLDHGDNCMSGGTCDTMDVLASALEQGLTGILSGPLCDPEAVAQMIAAGVGATVDIAIGNKRAAPKLGSAQARKAPFAATGVVRALSDGEYLITGPTYTGQRGYMGRTAVLDIGRATLVVCERTHEPWDLGVFESVGIDPRRARFVILKSRMYCRPVFVPIAAALVECDSRGVTSSDYALFPFERVTRPTYPLDPL